MSHICFPKPLRGIVPPMVTPLLGHDRLDCDGLERLIERILAGGVSALFLLGTTGEGASLSYRLRRELIERACAQVNRRVPTLVTITDTALEESLHLARHAAQHGANALVVSPPQVMTELQSDLRFYLEHLISQLPLPVFLYHMPPLTKAGFSLETVRWAMDQPQIVGLKDSSADVAHFQQLSSLLPRRADWTLLAGPEELLAETVQLGGHGGVCGGANLFPKLYVTLYEAARNRDQPRIRDLQSKVLAVVDNLYRLENHSSAVVKGIKCALASLGICSDFMEEPFHQFSAEKKSRITGALKELQPLIQLD